MGIFFNLLRIDLRGPLTKPQECPVLNNQHIYINNNKSHYLTIQIKLVDSYKFEVDNQFLFVSRAREVKGRKDISNYRQ